MGMRRRRPCIETCALFLACASAALAAGDDPYGTSALTAPAPSAFQGQPGLPCDFPPIEGRTIDLAEVLDRALCNNPQTRQTWAVARFQAAQVGVARSAYRPTITGNAGLGRSFGEFSEDWIWNLDATLSYLLYDFGGRDAANRAALALLSAANYDQDAVLQDVLLGAAAAWFNLLSGRAAVIAALESEKSAQESLKAAQARHLAGVATRADKLQAQTAYSQAVLIRVRAEGEARTAEGVLADAMGLVAGTPFRVAQPEPADSEAFGRGLAELMAEAQRLRPELVVAQALIEAGEAGIAVAKAEGKPKLSLRLTPSLSGGDGFTDSGAVLSVNAEIPLYTGHRTAYQVRAAEALLEQRQAEKAQLENRVALDVWRAYHASQTEQTALSASDDLLASAIESEKVALGRYKAGVGNILDVLTAQVRLAAARQQQVSARYNLQVSRFALARAVGYLGRDTYRGQP
jgi:outer membrane protein